MSQWHYPQPSMWIDRIGMREDLLAMAERADRHRRYLATACYQGEGFIVPNTDRLALILHRNECRAFAAELAERRNQQ